MDTPRYAIYFAPPPESALWKFGSAWIGRDAASGKAEPQPTLATFPSDQLVEATAEPRRYGFHATLKAPMVLRSSATEMDLMETLQGFARTQRAFVIPGLAVAVLGQFMALVPTETPPALTLLAAGCVDTFDSFRAQASDAELARRRIGLSDRQEVLLRRWGYPYVMEEYRFHMSLTGRMSPAELDVLRRQLEARWGPLFATPLTVDAVTLFSQPSTGSPFTIVGRYPFGA